MHSIEPEITVKGETLIVQWNNRDIPKSCSFRFMEFYGAGFCVVWTAVILGGTPSMLAAEGPILVKAIFMILAYGAVLYIPMTLWLGNTIEQIEIDNRVYRHHYAKCPWWFWWFPKEWPIEDITRIDYGKDSEESYTTLNVRRGRKRDTIAFCAKDEFRGLLFDVIQKHLSAIQSPIDVVKQSYPYE